MKTSTTVHRTDALEEALVAAGHGFRVHPLHGIRNGRCTCSKGVKCPGKGKHPRLAGWQGEATTDPVQIERWWEEFPDSNVGLVTGATSGVIVLDVDPRRAGFIGLELIEERYGPLPETAHVITGSGGWHLYYRHPGGHVRDSNDALGPGLELKADASGQGSNIVLPGSMHACGRTYEWEWSSHPDDVPLAEAPEWLYERADPDATEQTDQTETISLCSVCSVADAVRLSLPRRGGERNQRIFKFCCLLKTNPAYVEAEARDLRNEFRQWWDAALPFIRTKEWEESWSDFLVAWPKAQPLEHDPVAQATERARLTPTPECARDYTTSECVLLVKLCRELQRASGDGHFYLSCRKAGEVVNIDHTTAARWLKMLVAQGTLRIVKAHTATRARRYRYCGDWDGDAPSLNGEAS